MFDKVILNAHIACADHAEYLIYREHLQRCSEGDKVFWQSTSLANIDGVSMRLKGGNVQIKCSLHKMFYKGVTGHLDNTQMFTISQAKAIVHELLSRWEIDIGAVRVTYYEIGLNIPVNDDPLGYIASVHTIGSRQKEFFNDANFQKYRQKTTEKGRTIKKVFKIYDKGFEARSKDHFCDENILRLETIYRRQNIPLDVFLSDGELKKILDIYYRDWLSMEFDRRVVAEKGMKSSQLEKAVRIIRDGPERYMSQMRDDWKSGMLTDKQYRTIREFVQKWPDLCGMFQTVQGPKELEIREKFEKLFNEAKK